MGTDIEGWIEYQNILVDEEAWYPAIRLGVLYPIGRDYDAFGYFFGVGNAVVQPLAAYRGLPANLSSEVKQYATSSSSFFAQSWIRYDELKKSGWQWDTSWEPVIKVLEISHVFMGKSIYALLFGLRVKWVNRRKCISMSE